VNGMPPSVTDRPQSGHPPRLKAAPCTNTDPECTEGAVAERGESGSDWHDAKNLLGGRAAVARVVLHGSTRTFYTRPP